MSRGFLLIWQMAQPLLFALIGAEIDFDLITASLVGKRSLIIYMSNCSLYNDTYVCVLLVIVCIIMSLATEPKPLQLHAYRAITAKRKQYQGSV